MSDTAIKFEHVGKLYQLGVVGTGTLSHDLRRWWITSVRGKEDPYLKIGETNDRASKGHSDFVYALKDIDFEVKQGDVLGIIGKNGAGKSTLLKLLSRVTYPTTGKIYTKGRIASLLEVGTGFHPELTGRENIYMNGTILGMKKWEIDKKLDEIIDFSGCERYLDTPVKRYSSGMTVRLGFAIAAHLDPEILVVDEVLAVGDAEFQKKAIGKMQDVSKGEGRTVLFVSHNMTAVKNLCSQSVLLENGMLADKGKTDAIIRRYLSADYAIDGFDMTHVNDFEGNGKLRIGKVEIFSEGFENGVIVNNRPVTLRFEILNAAHLNGNLEIACVIRNIDKTYVTYLGSRLNKLIAKIPNEDKFSIEATIESFPFTPQNYYLGVELSVNKERIYWRDEAIKFTIRDNDFYETGDRWDRGIVLLKQNWKLC